MEEEKLKKQYKILSKIIICMIIIVLIFSTIFTFALYKDIFFGSIDVNFGDVEINVKDGVSDTAVLNFNVTRTNSNGTSITKAMPGDEVTISVKLTLASGSEPCYYLISVWGTREIFGAGFNSDYFYENDEVYVIDENTRHLPNDLSTTTESYVGVLNKNETKIIDISTKIPLSTEKETFIKYSSGGAKARCMIYAVQQANLTQLQAYNTIKELMPQYYYCDEFGLKDLSGGYIAFGKYPQTVKDSSVTILGDADENGYYTGSDGEKYAQLSANPNGGTGTFSNGASFNKNQTYYFKVEPILWQILKTEDGKATLITKNVIEQIQYQLNSNFVDIDDTYYLNSGVESYDGEISDGTEYANNYKFSNLRTWLNTNFLNLFALNEQTIIQSTIVDNSKSTTQNSSNSWITEDYSTTDKVFALSFKEYSRVAYFANDAARIKKATDYFLAKYTIIDNGHADYWARSPQPYHSNWVNRVLRSGQANNAIAISDVRIGVCPAIVIEL